MKESVLSFACEGNLLVGILAEPDDSPAEIGIVIIVGGPQYRAGSHRQFALLARHLAGNGFATLRFDCRGMGDSAGKTLDFLGIDADIAASINALLAARPGLKKVVLWGLCDAASAALLYLDSTRDTRVTGLVLLNPWVRNEQSLARTHLKHYYRQRLTSPDFWRKLLRGGTAFRAAKGLLYDIVAASSTRIQPAGTKPTFQSRMARAWASQTGPVLLLLSGRDHTAQEFVEYTRQAPEWQQLLDTARVHRRDLPEADHTFSSAHLRGMVENHTLEWLRQGLTNSNG